jgi:hypothetical protein
MCAGNGAGMNFTSLPQIQPIDPSTRISSPIAAITTVATEPRRSTGLIVTSSTRKPPANAIPSVHANAGQ